MTFNAYRREPFLDESSFNWNVQFTMNDVLPDLEKDISDASLNPLDRAEALWRISSEYFDHAIRLYSAGAPVADIQPYVLKSIDYGFRFIDGIEDGSQWPQLDLAVQTHYVHSLWLLSLATLLGLGDEQIERVANFYAADETNDGADELFEILLAKLGRTSYPAEGLIHEDPYQLLLDCIKAEPDDRPALMTEFLKRWFKGQKECDWWGSHIPRKGTTVLDTGFFGYWAFEAALVTYLWDIDDSSYRDLPHYPKDLIDRAREHARDLSDGGPNGTGRKPRPNVPAGQPCPESGWWHTTAAKNSRRYFSQGDAMPKVEGSGYGDTYWLWDADQQSPKL